MAGNTDLMVPAKLGSTTTTLYWEAMEWARLRRVQEQTGKVFTGLVDPNTQALHYLHKAGTVIDIALVKMTED